MFNKILNSPNYIIYIIPFILGTLTTFSFQPFNFTIINFIVLPLLFLTLVYVNKRTKSHYRKKPYNKNFFLIGLVFGFSFYLSGIYWISYSLTFDDNFKFLIPFAILFIPLFLSLFTALTTLIIGRFLSYNLYSIILFSAAFSIIDFIRGKILTGFPWNLWAYSWSWLTDVLQSLNYLGLYAFNLIAITIFTVPALVFFKTSIKLKIATLSLILLLFFSNYIFGSFSINKNKALLNFLKKEDSINVKVISPNFELKYNYSEEEIKDKLLKLIRYSEIDSDKKTIFIWPEGVFTGFYFKDIKKFSNIFKNKFNQNHKIILGINTYDLVTDDYFNSLLVVDHDFQILHKYNKTKLVPFGEFLPFENFFNKLGLKKITQGHGSFAKGQELKTFKIENIIFLPLICYEIIFPELLQKSKKSNMIVNISEDGWFGNSIGPHQHFAKAIFRSIESNSYLARSANKGISAIINNKGEIIKKLDVNEAGNIEMNIPLIETNYKNKNDLIFFILLFTYLLIYLIFNIKNNAKK